MCITKKQSSRLQIYFLLFLKYLPTELMWTIGLALGSVGRGTWINFGQKKAEQIRQNQK